MTCYVFYCFQCFYIMKCGHRKYVKIFLFSFSGLYCLLVTILLFLIVAVDHYLWTLETKNKEILKVIFVIEYHFRHCCKDTVLIICTFWGCCRIRIQLHLLRFLSIYCPSLLPVVKTGKQNFDLGEINAYLNARM